MLLSTLLAGLISSIAQAQHQAHHELLCHLTEEAGKTHEIGGVEVPGVALTPAEVLAPTEIGLDTSVGVRPHRDGLRVCRGSNLRIRVRYQAGSTPEAVARLRVAAERTIDRHGR